LVQTALRRSLGSTETLPAHLVEVAAADHEGVREVQERMRAEAQAIFRSGYEIGIRLARVMPWDLLDYMSRDDFDLEGLGGPASSIKVDPRLLEAEPSAVKLAQETGVSYDSPDWADFLGTLWDIFDFASGQEERRGETQELGIRRAFRDIWRAVRKDPLSTDDVSEGGDT
jgi:hypothetical protein